MLVKIVYVGDGSGGEFPDWDIVATKGVPIEVDEEVAKSIMKVMPDCWEKVGATKTGRKPKEE